MEPGNEIVACPRPFSLTKSSFGFKIRELLKVTTGAIIRDGDRKRGVHASPCVVPKKSIFRKNCATLHKPARIHANVRGANTSYWKMEENVQFGFDKNT